MIKKLNNSGDTIVEVLIAIAVVSIVLSGAFVASNRSMSASQQAQERSVATKLLETQLERLKSIASSEPIFTGPILFCVDGSQNQRNITSPLPSIGLDDLSTPPYSAECLIDSSNNTFSGASQSTKYAMSIERDGVDPNKFTVRARWLRAGAGGGSGGREQASIVYRLYQ